ncbi:ribosome hibernation-promoting factor, HPF/YfiA family [Natranaerofaba carboxydovora]|uniref:ribosome hibernation-promoting factor, HPF/YfiA family n=1 Tax=Natranaerofaba carboxydovora TaxID=2742683 RepID=UPI001F138FAC|nr:ribosome-associated translation inhibitor RaiA [Natranaerofaba carboxydovora]UMZ74950.1 Ribosome hibernation promotion factor [Natranaerofaba carboxydovora]
MELNIVGKNIDVTNALKEHADKRLSKLDRYFNKSVEAQVTMSVVKDTHIVEVTVFLNGGIILRAEDGTGDMYASIDSVLDKLERQVKKYKTRINRKLRQGGHKALAEGIPEELEEDEYPKIVRTKRFAMKPMDAEEAVMQMDLLGHDFFVFMNAETEEVNVVYKRKDGNYGQIEPEF